MSNILIDDSNLTNIADAIRNRLGTSDTYLPRDMGDAINKIQSGDGTEYLEYQLVSLEKNIIDNSYILATLTKEVECCEYQMVTFTKVCEKQNYQIVSIEVIQEA